ncbi:hypothetical protein [Saccharococcus caldoxylosilyticus]|uniref:Uncharacterized protein n=1 Tax=Saccharococcus caldoxylosilyticus TaxID=81408 RepID=A0A150LTV0_9BACL|nr:hypothetical protein [Parageobacillus caldoxylosilyticus]KYD15734.1 hypothetical protein B4119_2162 [Parageobacillus caldoxylosilyticus]QXJ36978.1 hypothetical protein BV455_00240 [Parageobacillus caldoxylosilyticus]
MIIRPLSSNESPPMPLLLVADPSKQLVLDYIRKMYLSFSKERLPD